MHPLGQSKFIAVKNSIDEYILFLFFKTTFAILFDCAMGIWRRIKNFDVSNLSSRAVACLVCCLIASLIWTAFFAYLALRGGGHKVGPGQLPGGDTASTTTQNMFRKNGFLIRKEDEEFLKQVLQF